MDMRIAVYGKLRSGKSVMCEHIKNNIDCDIIEFSGALQEVVDIMYPEYKGTKIRELLVGVGQHMREYDKDIWVNVVKYKILNSKKKNILVAGVRQQNEYDMLKELGFAFVEVVASEETRIDRCMKSNDQFNPASLNNELETILDTFTPTFVIENDGNLEELKSKTNKLLEWLEILENKRKIEDAFYRDGIKQFMERNKK